MEDFVRFAISKGVKKYGFSSHSPLPFHTKWNMVADDFGDYRAEFYRLKEKYADKIELFLGLEVDYIHGCADIKGDFFQHINLDYTIGSIHYLDKLTENSYWSIDGPFRDFDNGLTKLFGGDIRAGVRRFFEVSSFMVEKGGFDIVGHADKITFHGMKYRDFNPADKWFFDLMTDFLELIKEKNMIVEINTKSLHEHGLTFPHRIFYPLIREIGIPVHVNSDCHYPTNVIADFQQVYRQLYDVGFRTMHQLCEGKWTEVEFLPVGLI